MAPGLDPADRFGLNVHPLGQLRLSQANRLSLNRDSSPNAFFEGFHPRDPILGSDGHPAGQAPHGLDLRGHALAAELTYQVMVGRDGCH